MGKISNNDIMCKYIFIFMYIFINELDYGYILCIRLGLMILLTIIILLSMTTTSIINHHTIDAAL